MTSPLRLPDVLRDFDAHPRAADLARLAHLVCFTAMDERRTSPVGVREAAERLGLAPGDTLTLHGDVRAVLEAGPLEARTASERAIVAAALARGVSLSPPTDDRAELRTAEALAWLGAHAGVDAALALEAAMGPAVDPLLQAFAELARRADRGASADPASALVALLALRESRRPVAQAERELLRADLSNSLLRLALETPEGAATPSGGSGATGALMGELLPTPRGGFALAVLTFTGLLAVLRLARLASRLLLGYRRPTEVVVERTGVRVRTKVELLGKTLRDREIVLPREGLLSAEREVRYPRLPLYAGLLSLALGTYFGMALFVDGVRATSPDLLGLGVLFMAAGLAVDYGLGHLSQAVRGRARLVLAPRKGSRLAIEVPSAEAADQALVALR